MKPILLSLLAIGGFALTGCETTVVEHYPHHHPVPVAVYYSSGRPYYYTAGVRYWGYPAGYRAGYSTYGHSGYGYHEGYSHPHSRNVEVERNTYVVNNNRTVYVHGSPAPTYRAQSYHGHPAPGQPYTTTTTKKKKKQVYTY